MSIGIRNFFRKAATQTVTASTALVDLVGMSVPIAAGQKAKLRIWLPFTVGAAGGFKFQVTVPAGGTSFLASFEAVDGVTALPGAEISVVQAASAAFANAFAVAGSHTLWGEVDVVNGTTAGNIVLQMACNSAAGAIIALGGSIDVVYL